MASSPELVQYIADQLSPCGTITFKKMFGEYGLYLNGKMFASVCDELAYHYQNQPFDRIRRITGYLVGTLDRFNNAKRAEERDRVKHGISLQ